MSRDNTEYDVSIAKYKCTNQNMVNIKFQNDNELLFDTRRVRLEIVKTRIYFIDDNSKGSLAVQKNGCVVACKQYDKLSKFEGHYDMEFDQQRNQYYIDKDHLVRHYEHKFEQKGCRKQQPRRVVENKPDLKKALVTITEKGEKMIERTKIEELTEVKNPVGDRTFIFGLINLLKDQCRDNIKALYTINTLEESIERRIK